MLFRSNEETITLNNLFPIDPSNTTDMNDSTKVGTYSIDIEGDTDYRDGIEYLVSVTDANIYTNAGQALPISLDITTEGLGTASTNYFTEREATNTNIYKKLVGGTLVGDQMLLVGYIKPNTTSGTIEGIDGSITIKAYLDKNKILVTDTYDGSESDNMGTPRSMAQGKTVLTTEEWNAIQSSGVSFKVKVEANQGIWVNDTLDNIIRTKNMNITTNLPIMDNAQSEFVSATTGIDFGAVSSDTNGKGIYMHSRTANDAYPVVYYRGAVEDNNVLFNNLCWKMVRTTDTGGVKLIYNGVNKGTVETPNCNNTGSSTIITNYAFNNGTNSPAYVGYMYGDVYTYDSGAAITGAYFGSSYTYDNGAYSLINSSTTLDNAHHYTCNLTVANGTCETIRYYYYGNYYVNLTGGDGIEKAIEKMHTNTTNSMAKNVIDSWYANVMNTMTIKLEDTIWCNDRSVGNGNNNGWIANNGDLNTELYYGAYQRSNYASNDSAVKNQPSLVCPNKNDAFTVNNGNGNRKLTYPVALLTEDEIVLAGGLAGANSTFYLNNDYTYNWLLSPSKFTNSDSRIFVQYGSFTDYKYIVSNPYGLRPSVSLKPGMTVISGSGTVADPYVIG